MDCHGQDARGTKRKRIMSRHRFYCESIKKPVTELTGSEFEHLSKVLRLNSGQDVELFDGKGLLAEATIKEKSKKEAILRIIRTTQYKPRAEGRIILAVSIAKGQRFDWLIEKAAELGIDRITPVIFERTVRCPSNPKVLDRWTRLAVSAAKQSGRIFLPVIDNPLLLTEALEILQEQYDKAKIIFGSIDEKSDSLLKSNWSGSDIIVFVGPEGGLADDEQDLLKSKGAEPVRLTTTILRTETAALVFASILTTQRDSYKTG